MRELGLGKIRRLDGLRVGAERCVVVAGLGLGLRLVHEIDTAAQAKGSAGERQHEGKYPAPHDQSSRTQSRHRNRCVRYARAGRASSAWAIIQRWVTGFALTRLTSRIAIAPGRP